jgi:hypothetical protein
MRRRAIILLVLWVLPLAQGALAAEYRRPTAAQLEELRRWLCPNGGAPRAGAPGRCNGVGGARGLGGASSVPGWDRGLPAASHEQSTCPAGTRAVQARGHDDVMRCLPG